MEGRDLGLEVGDQLILLEGISRISGMSNINQAQMDVFERNTKTTVELTKSLELRRGFPDSSCDCETFKRMSPPSFNGDLESLIPWQLKLGWIRWTSWLKCWIYLIGKQWCLLLSCSKEKLHIVER